MPRAGELVLIEEAETPRGKWPRARILETDGRRAKVRLANGREYLRSIRWLYPLEVGSDENIETALSLTQVVAITTRKIVIPTGNATTIALSRIEEVLGPITINNVSSCPILTYPIQVTKEAEYLIEPPSTEWGPDQLSNRLPDDEYGHLLLKEAQEGVYGQEMLDEEEKTSESSSIIELVEIDEEGLEERIEDKENSPPYTAGEHTPQAAGCGGTVEMQKNSKAKQRIDTICR
jgi:hypothetical protein